MFQVVTTQNEKYYNGIGKYCIKAFLEKWPNSISLYLYAEDFVPDILDERLKVVDSTNVIDQWKKFCSTQKHLEHYERYKIFWLKSLVLLDMYKNSNSDYVIWLDSDVITTNELSIDFLYKLIDREILLCDLPCGGVLKDREAETGFTILNLQHSLTQNFIDEYSSYYTDLNKFSTLLREVDGEIWWRARSFAENIGAKVHGIKTTKDNKVPMSGSILANYLAHYTKGKHKTNFIKSVNV